MYAQSIHIRSDRRYSEDIVYNHFRWATAQREMIEQTAQGLPDARTLYPEASMADPTTSASH